MTQEQTAGEKRWFGRPVWIIAASIILYPLSIGPTLWLLYWFPAYLDWWNTFYFPIRYIASQSGRLEHALGIYVEWWLTHFPFDV